MAIKLHFFISVSLLVLGLVAHPLDWDQLTAALASGTLTILNRTQQCTNMYNQFREYLKQKNDSLPDFVKEQILGFNNHPRENIYLLQTAALNREPVFVYLTGPRVLADQVLNKQIALELKSGVNPQNKFMLLAQNNFPYDLTPDIRHWVIWSSDDFERVFVESVLASILNPQLQHQFYMNPPNMKSIPEISHLQLFLKSSPNTQL